VGILALHYVTNHPAEEHLGVKELPASGRHPNALNVYRGTECETSINSAQTRVWASDWDSDDTVITTPNRIFVSTSYEVGKHPSDFPLFYDFSVYLDHSILFVIGSLNRSHSSTALMNTLRSPNLDHFPVIFKLVKTRGLNKNRERSQSAEPIFDLHQGIMVNQRSFRYTPRWSTCSRSLTVRTKIYVKSCPLIVSVGGRAGLFSLNAFT
jgi:hypothetical protein